MAPNPKQPFDPEQEKIVLVITKNDAIGLMKDIEETYSEWGSFNTPDHLIYEMIKSFESMGVKFDLSRLYSIEEAVNRREEVLKEREATTAAEIASMDHSKLDKLDA